MTLATTRLRYPETQLALGADGYVPLNSAEFNDGCCPDPLCVPVCSTACSFVDLLPSGPMWDRQKEAAKSQLEECGGEPGEEACPTMAGFAIYAARVMHDMVDNILWPTIRESSPATAVATLDDWLDRYGWQDCYRSTCRSEYDAMFSPYENQGACGSYYCPTDFSIEFECALKHAILQALVRMQRGVIKNLDGINWVIAPLGATLAPRRPWPADVQRFLNNPCPEDELNPCFCDEVALHLSPSGDTLPGCPTAACGSAAEPVSARQRYRCGTEDPVQLYPGIIAAECIVRAMLTRKCPNIITHTEPTASALCTVIIDPDTNRVLVEPGTELVYTECEAPPEPIGGATHIVLMDSDDGFVLADETLTEIYADELPQEE